jgi:hypothetical protein
LPREILSATGIWYVKLSTSPNWTGVVVNPRYAKYNKTKENNATNNLELIIGAVKKIIT